MTRHTYSDKRTHDPLARFRVIDRLEVGPTHVERNRLTAPYTVVQGARIRRTNLVYRFEETVFDPANPSDRNLASMIACQIAVNYGLFCREIVFHGNFDDADRHFLTDMTENTAREIFVKKLLEPNIFLSAKWKNVPLVRRKHYTHANLRFPGSGRTHTILWGPKTADRRRCIVLSSGGKDSLLTYGLLNEMGFEIKPVFGNESGHHWTTALNAYRYFAAGTKGAGRVWMNSDRVFNWMLRRFPFIRKDFASLRSDEYPIRLWTVAVFLFGALPIARKTGAGRIIIGDEYDTTVRANTRGIPHYDGLYDQSRFFDAALTRYYRKKGMALTQCSILRPLSELLIEKILSQRYPAIFRHQVSCHAAHVAGRRVVPCGRCEKCRRVVGMLMALGSNPATIGYTKKTIRRCLADLGKKTVRQETAAAHEMLFLLAKKGLVSLSSCDKQSIREHPETLQLRFDSLHSPINTIPRDMRIPLFRILLRTADGAVRRKGKKWLPFDL